MKKPAVVIVAVVFFLLGAARASLAQAVCGNGVREAGEQCDDGNDENLDGCSSACTFEQVHRVNTLKLQRLTGPDCTANKFGGALTPTALDNMQTEIDSSIADGSASLLFTFHGLDDLSGTNDASLQVGVVNAAPINPADPDYDGNNDLEWWYAPDDTDIDGSRAPVSLLSGAIATGLLTAGPGPARMKFPVGTVASVDMSRFRIRAMTGAASAPLAATAPDPPGHLASENLDPALTSFASSGSGVTGALCGNVSAASMKAIPIPASMVGAACSNRFTSANSLLDVWIRGCTLSVIPLILATQPDQEDPDAPPAGAGPPYTLQFNAANVVTTCRDSTAAVVDLTACLDDAAYSSFWLFTTDRVMATRACPNAPVASNDGPVCAGETVQLTAQGPSGTYSWTGPNGYTSSLQNPTIPNAAAAASGTYEATVTLGGCTSPAGTTTVTVHSTAPPSIAAPSGAAPGASGLIASVEAHAGSTFAWSIANGQITAGHDSNQITFTAGSSGIVELSVIETGANGCASEPGQHSVTILVPPQNVVATALAETQVRITWSAVPGASGYEIVRTGTDGTVVLGPTVALLFDDMSVGPGAAYLYSVRARDASGNAANASSPDLATTVFFADDPLAATSTPVRALHINELRSAVAAVRALVGIPPFAFGDPVAAGTPIDADHVSSLRTALETARQGLALPPVVYGDPVITAGITLVKAAHIEELRSGTR